MVHQIGKGLVVHGFRQVHPVGTRQFRLHHFPHFGILMYGENSRRFRMLFQRCFQRPVHLPHGFPQILPPVGGHEDQPFPAGQRFINHRIRKHKILFYRGVQRINYGISRYIDGFFRHIFFQ